MNNNNHGGYRPGSGRKPKNKESIRIVKDHSEALKEAKKARVPDWMESDQLEGNPDLLAKDVKIQLEAWLIERGVRQYVPDDLIDTYSIVFARYVQIEEKISREGFVFRHPKSGALTASPYVSISIDYNKRMTSLWSQIYQMIRDSSETPIEAPQTNSLLELLRKKYDEEGKTLPIVK